MTGLALAIDGDLQGADLSGMDLSGRDLSRADLRGARLAGANLEGAVLFQARLDGAEFMGANLRGAQLMECEGVGVGFGRADLAGADLCGAVLHDASFTAATLTGADLRGADLRRARFAKACLQGTDFTSAVLAEAELTSGSVAGASFRDADLRGALLRRLTGFETCDWVGADLRDTHTCGAYELRRFAHDQNYLEEFYAHGAWNRAVYAVWWATSDCGRSFLRWAGFTVALALLFAVVFSGLAIDYGDHQTWLSPLYFSVVTLTTLGYGDALPTDVFSQAAVMVEVVCGYCMLGGLLSILSNKMARRAS